MRAARAALLAFCAAAAPARGQESVAPPSVEGGAVSPNGEKTAAPAQPSESERARARGREDGSVLDSLRRSVRRDAPQVDLPDLPSGGAIDPPPGGYPPPSAERAGPAAGPRGSVFEPPAAPPEEGMPRFMAWSPGGAPLPAEQNLRMRALASPEIFAELGLVPTGDGQSAVRKDGSPATAAELARLRVRLDEEPRAREPYPDFFRIFSRQAFAGLKSLFRQIGPQRPDFQDVALSPEGRDFLWSTSCQSVSQQCNPHASRGSYVKGRYVPPQDLRSMWNAFGRPVWDPYPDPRAGRGPAGAKTTAGLPWDPQPEGPGAGGAPAPDGRRRLVLAGLAGAAIVFVLLLLLRSRGREAPRIEIG